MVTSRRWKRLVVGLGFLNTISVVLGIAGLLVFTLYKDEGYFLRLFSQLILSFRIPLLIGVVVSLLCLAFIINKRDIRSSLVFIYCLVLFLTTLAMAIFSSALSLIMTSINRIDTYPNITKTELNDLEIKVMYFMKKDNWIDLSRKENCCGLKDVNDMLGNNTVWESEACHVADVKSCSMVIPISFCLKTVLIPSYNALLNEMDYEMLISCLSVFAFVITIAYSMYFFTCFRKLMMYNQKPDIPVISLSKSSISLLDNEEYQLQSSQITPLP